MNELKEEIINNSKNMIYSIALKYKHINSVEDSFQAGVIGLIKAYKNYNKNSNCEFSSYAYKYIQGEIIKNIKENRNIKASDNYYKIYKAYEKTKECLTTKLNREPSLIEISKFMDIDYSYLIDVITSCAFTTSININDEDFSLLDVTGIDNTNNLDDLLDLKEAINKLKDNEKRLIELRYFKDYTQVETAKALNMSQVEVSRNESKILKKINYQMRV